MNEKDLEKLKEEHYRLVGAAKEIARLFKTSEELKNLNAVDLLGALGLIIGEVASQIQIDETMAMMIILNGVKYVEMMSELKKKSVKDVPENVISFPTKKDN